MIDVELLGTHPDGNQLILNDAEGKRYCLAITSQLREVLKEKPNLQLVAEIPHGSALRPAQIQTLLRAGMSAQTIAEKYAVSLDKISLFEGPILAERNWKAEQMRNFQIGEAPDSPRLSEIAIDRLAARGVATATIRWDAYREERSSWHLVLHFVQDAQKYHATWEANLSTQKLKAVDEEARWLSETPRVANLDDSLEDFLSSPFTDIAAPVNSSPLTEASLELEPAQGTEALLEALNNARGRRGGFDPSEFVDLDEDDDAEIMEALFAENDRESSEQFSASAPILSAQAATPRAGIEMLNPLESDAFQNLSTIAPQAASDSAPPSPAGEVSALVAKVAAENHQSSQVTSLLDFKSKIKRSETEFSQNNPDIPAAIPTDETQGQNEEDFPVFPPLNALEDERVDFGVHGLSDNDKYATNELTGELEDPVTGAKRADIVANLQQKVSDSSPVSESEETTLPGMGALEKESAQTQKRNARRKNKRQSFPSWDEVVFGVKTPKK